MFRDTDNPHLTELVTAIRRAKLVRDAVKEDVRKHNEETLDLLNAWKGMGHKMTSLQRDAFHRGAVLSTRMSSAEAELRNLERKLLDSMFGEDAAIEAPEPAGFHPKYLVIRTNGSSRPGGKHEHCDYFVLDWKHDKFARPAALAYADACEAEFPALARDLRMRAAVNDEQLPPVLPERIVKVEAFGDVHNVIVSDPAGATVGSVLKAVTVLRDDPREFEVRSVEGKPFTLDTPIVHAPVYLRVSLPLGHGA